MEGLKLVKIPEHLYEDYKLDVIFNAYKWDPQVGDVNTVSKYVLLITEENAEMLKTYAEALTKETVELQKALLSNLSYTKVLGIDKKIKKSFIKHQSENHFENHVSLMRYDFHPTTKGFMISEVNSDVPGGLAEATALPNVAKKYIGYGDIKFDIADSLYKSYKEKNKDISSVAFVHATSYADDRQVMQYIGDYFETKGIKSHYVGPTMISFKDKVAYLNEEKIDGLFRFFPLEWFLNLPRKYKWDNYFSTNALSCNHPLNILSQSKRLPLIWDKLNIDLKTWKKLLPHTVDPKLYFKDEKYKDNYIFKPTFGRVGEGVMIDEVIGNKVKQQIIKAAKKYPKAWVLQQRFESVPLTADNESYHLCIGVFTVNDKCAGFYGRISHKPRIDEHAVDIPILVVKGEL